MTLKILAVRAQITPTISRSPSPPLFSNNWMKTRKFSCLQEVVGYWRYENILFRFDIQRWRRLVLILALHLP